MLIYSKAGLKACVSRESTRIYCLEGNNANLYTTDAMATIEHTSHLIPQRQKPTKTYARSL